ncbi:hypothetical protein ACWC5C_31800 [Streptomyces sp. NPDC001700]
MRETRFRLPVRHDELTAADIRGYDRLRTRLLDAFVSVFAEADLLISPVNAVTGVRNDPTGNTVGPRRPRGERRPGGDAVAARRHNDATVVRAAAALEAQSPWHGDYQRVWRSLAATG